MRKSIRFTCVAASLTALCCHAEAQSVEPQAAQVFTPRPTIARAIDVIEQYPEKVAVGTQVTFKRKATRSAERLLSDGLQVRVFSLDAHSTEPTPLTTVNGCNVYLSAVYPISATADDNIPFKRLDDGWLNLSNSENSIREARYYLVFEKAGPESALFKLRSSDAKAYFATGFSLGVFDNGNGDLQAVRLEYEKRKLSLGRLYHEVDNPSSDVPCYRYVQYAGAPDAIELAAATLENCRRANDEIQPGPLAQR